ncbi:glycosyltransferase [Nocardioides sp. zg-579]|uniref:Glycosyltransferase n=1 Tax=Nocardioides marmotae TaxID=2663857 RepID=A0A6I3JCC3_9ACTN|nr:glycosyltransferase family 4 protein [Nocardioides marmotae]MCR6032180.1 glycosyltransferase [Gordonia jinghuaiqii]MTB95826.1 glycosyltransferase [Nocardioides marmotae]QKE02821.1 glycosyltransferase family 4 protein [Nocardioides marmotae]
MKILHITPAVFRVGQRGGGERYFNEFARALHAINSDQRLFSVPKLHQAFEVDPGSFDARPSTIRSLHEAMRAADIVHIHQLNTPGFDHALIQRLRGRTPIVLSDYGGGRVTPGRALGRRRNRLINGLAAISNWSVYDVDPDNVIPVSRVIYGAGDHVLRNGSLGTLADKNEVDFVFVGRLLPHKGAHVAIQALPDGATMTIAGEVRDPEYYHELRTLASGKKVDFVGSPEDTELPNLYASARFCVLPSVESYGEQKFTRPELLGLVVLEALACGTSAIGSQTGGLAEILEVTGQYAATPGDIASWNRVMTHALEYPDPACLHNFTWAEVAESTQEVYSQVLAQKK